MEGKGPFLVTGIAEETTWRWNPRLPVAIGSDRLAEFADDGAGREPHVLQSGVKPVSVMAWVGDLINPYIQHEVGIRLYFTGGTLGPDDLERGNYGLFVCEEGVADHHNFGNDDGGVGAADGHDPILSRLGVSDNQRFTVFHYDRNLGEVIGVHPHYHLVVLDGVFSKADDNEVEFHEAYDLAPNHIAQVESVVQRRVLRYFRRHGLLDELAAAGMLTWQGSGGFSVDASVRIEAEDRAGVETQFLA